MSVAIMWFVVDTGAGSTEPAAAAVGSIGSNLRARMEALRRERAEAVRDDAVEPCRPPLGKSPAQLAE